MRLTSCKESSCLETYAVSTLCVVAFVAFCQSSVKPYVSPPAAKCRKFCSLVVTEGSDTIQNRVDGFMNLNRNLRILPESPGFWNLKFHKYSCKTLYLSVYY